MNVSAWSIRNPTPAILLFVVLTIAGALAFKALRIQQFMDIDLPMVTVTTSLPGAAPAQLENDVAKKLENSIATLTGIKHIYTFIQDSTVIVTTEFRLEKPTQEAVDEMRDAVSRVRTDLPQNLTEPVISRINLSGQPVLTYTVASTRMDDEALSWFVDDTIKRALLAVPGIGAVSRVGGVEREVRVELDAARLLALNVTAADVSRQLRRIQQDAAAGSAKIGGTEQSLRALGMQQTANDLAMLEIALPDGRHVRLSDVAHVVDTIAEPRSVALQDGKPVVGFDITRSRGAGEVEVRGRVEKVLAQLKAERPDISITEAFNFVDPVLENYKGSLSLLLEGALLAIIVVWLFLRDTRATLVAATALPLSVLPTFAAIYLMDFSLNVVTLLSLSLVVGVLVDDAIVEIENIMRHLRAGKPPYQAAMEAADEIGLAVIATTFTLIAVFLPTAFMSGIVGKFFVQFGWTAAIAVFFSLVVARMLTPMMAAYLLQPASEIAPPRWLATYQRWVAACLAHRVRTVLAAAGFFVISFMLVPFLPTGFMPPDDISQTQVRLALAPGSTLQQTLKAAETARHLVSQNPYVKHVYTAVGGGAAGNDPFMPATSAEVRRATLTLNLTPRGERSGVNKQMIEQDLRTRLEALPGAQIKVGLGGNAEKYVLALIGQDGEVLSRHARLVERELRTLPGIGQVISSATLARPEVTLQPDFARMAEQGVTTDAIADTLRVATSGDYEQYLAKLNFPERQVPINVRLPETARADFDLLRQLKVPGRHGAVALGAIASVSFGSGPAQISRYDRLRNINFEIELNNQPLGEVEKLALALPSVKNLPPGVKQASIGDAEAQAELFAGFSFAMLTCVICIYVVLVLLFHDFVQPLTILAALILSIPGAFLALFVTHSALSMPSMIGLIMLMGIASKNSILLVDYVVMARREQGLARLPAVMDACAKRARPIIMTTIAMGAGMLPIALGLGTDPSFRAPMAVVVIGGLITSTFLSLLVIPVVFTYVDDLIERARKLFKRSGAARSPGAATDS